MSNAGQILSQLVYACNKSHDDICTPPKSLMGRVVTALNEELVNAIKAIDGKPLLQYSKDIRKFVKDIFVCNNLLQFINQFLKKN